MKRLLLLCSAVLLLAACTQENDFGNKPIPENLENLTNDSYAVPVEEALKTLSRALDRIDGATRAGRTRSVQSIETVKASRVMNLTRSTPAEGVENLFYVVSFGEGNGSAVLGADKRLDPIYAILDETVLTAEDFQQSETRSEMTEEIDWVSDEQEMEEFIIDLLLENAIAQSSIITPITPEIPSKYRCVTTYHVDEDCFCEPCLNTRWHQNSPFNSRCPILENGSRALAGCTPVALGQFLNYKRLPNFNVIRGYTFDWTLLDKCAVDGLFPLMARLEVAHFIRNIGLECDARYEIGGTYAWLGDFSPTLAEMGVIANEIQYTYSAAKAIIRNDDLVCISGFDSNGNGHSWVLDGLDVYIFVRTDKLINENNMVISVTNTDIERRELVHCNFGWNGSCDGYYTYSTYEFDAGYLFDRQFSMLSY